MNSHAFLPESQYDAIVLGTGMVESILAAFVKFAFFLHFFDAEHLVEVAKKFCTWTIMITMVPNTRL